MLAMLMLPFRITLYLFFMFLLYPLLTTVALLRAIFLRMAVGAPSEILKYGTRGNVPKKDE